MHLNVRFTRIAVGLVLLTSVAALSLSLCAGTGQRKVSAADNCRYFSETNHSVCGAFLDYWNTHGQIAQQGYPVSDVFSERNQPIPAGDGNLHNVQYFERARFEEHTESATNPVQLGLLGSEQYGSKYKPAPTSQPNSQQLVINSKSTVSSIGGATAGSGNVFIVLDVTLTDSSANAIRSSTDGFALSNSQPLQYFVSPQSGNLDNPWSSMILFPGKSQTGKIAFEVPTGFQPTSLIFMYSDFKATVNY